MALTENNKVLANDFLSLKNRVKSEMNRRCHTDSLVAYADASYDYNVIPTADTGSILVEHINKIITPMNAISSTGFNSNQQSGAEIVALDNINT